MTPTLQNAIVASAKRGDAIVPATLLAVLSKEETPLHALSHSDYGNTFFDALNHDFPFFPFDRIGNRQFKSDEFERLSGLIRWLVSSLHTWTKTIDPDRSLLGALFVVLQSLQADQSFWLQMPPSISKNTELMNVLAELVSCSQFEFSARDFDAVPIWEEEAIEEFKQADQAGNWVEIGKSWRQFENVMPPSFIFTQAIICLAHYSFDQVVLVADSVSQTIKAMIISKALSPNMRLRLAAASSSPYIEFCCVYAATTALGRVQPLQPIDPKLLVPILVKVSADGKKWDAWMEAFNHWPTRFPSIHAALGEALALMSEDALQSYIESTNMLTLDASNDEGRQLTTDCLRAFKSNANVEKRRYLWKLAYNKWSIWDFNPSCLGQINKICYSVLDYAVVGYLVECMDEDKCRTARDGVTTLLCSVDEAWYVSVSDCITEWNRLLSKFQLYAHAVNTQETGEDWLRGSKEYWPFKKNDEKYLCQMFYIR